MKEDNIVLDNEIVELEFKTLKCNLTIKGSVWINDLNNNINVVMKYCKKLLIPYNGLWDIASDTVSLLI